MWRRSDDWGCLLFRCLAHGGNVPVQPLRYDFLCGACQYAAISIGGSQRGREYEQCVEPTAAQYFPYRLHQSRVAGKNGGVPRFPIFIPIAQGNRVEHCAGINRGLDERRVEMPELFAVCRSAFRKQPYANTLQKVQGETDAPE